MEIAQTDPSIAIAHIKQRIVDSDDLVTKIKSSHEALSDVKLTELVEVLVRVKEAKDAYEIARGNSFGDELVAGVGSTTWKTLWSAAREYVTVEVYANSSFPPDGTKGELCPLCHQSITPETGERLRRFEAFVSDKTEKLLRER
jgi:hypothetical protein